MRGTSSRLFLAVSLLIAVTDAGLVAANIYFARKTFHEGVRTEGEAARAIFSAGLEQALRDMSSLATFIAGDRDVQRLFRAGRDAVRSEGGGPGGPEAAKARQALLNKVAPSWRLVQKRFDARQLHFHIGPGSLSFLRVHAPRKFGDRMDDLRHLIVHTDRTLQPQSGFETGRIYAGVRGSIPIITWDESDEPDYLGVLEVGTSMQPLLEMLSRNHGWQLATLLRSDHVDAAMWDDYEHALFPDGGGDCGCVVEAATSPLALPLIQALRTDGHEPFKAGANVVTIEGRSWAVTHFPLRDFLGQIDPRRDAVGTVLMWHDVTPAVQNLERSERFNLLYAIAAFLILEILLYGTMRLVSRRLRAEVTEKTEALARSNRDLEDFVYVASHDLREPLRMVSSYLGLVQRRYAAALDDRGKEFLNHASQGALRMDSMLQSLTDLSRVSTRGAPMTELDLQEITTDALTNLTVALEESKARISVEPPLPMVAGDRAQLTRLIQNLIANALKFQPPGQVPEIRIWADQDTLGHCHLHVADNGIGIAEDQQERIFQMFQRLHTREEYDGSGIGLAICRRIAERHGGSLGVSSTPGQGSVFTVTLRGLEL